MRPSESNPVRRRSAGHRAVAVLVAFVAMLAATVTGPTAATASAADADILCTNLIINRVSWGGTYYCNYGEYEGYDYATLSDGTFQVFVVGKDYAVWTKWRNPQGALSSWVSLGGAVATNGYSWYLQTYARDMGGYLNWVVRVVGTTGTAFCRYRDGRTGGWSPSWQYTNCL